MLVCIVKGPHYVVEGDSAVQQCANNLILGKRPKLIRGHCSASSSSMSFITSTTFYSLGLQFTGLFEEQLEVFPLADFFPEVQEVRAVLKSCGYFGSGILVAITGDVGFQDIQRP